MTRLLAAAALAAACVPGTVTPASAHFELCDHIECAVTCLPACIPDPIIGCYYVDPFGLVCI